MRRDIVKMNVLTGVSGSRENRFSLSSLLAERIRSSVSEMYCKTQTEREKQSHNNWILNHIALFEAVAMENELPLPALD